MFHNQRKRLLRKENWTADDLAQELWAMFGPNVPLEHRGPITIYQDGDQPAITFRDYGDGDTVFEIRGRDDDISSDITVSGDPGGGSASFGGGGGGGMPGQVVSSVSSTVYNVRVYPNGLSAASSVVQVTQLQIASGQTIPTGTWAIIALAGGSYYMQVPVWL